MKRSSIKGKFTDWMSMCNFHTIHDVHKFIAKRHNITVEELKEIQEAHERGIKYFISNPIQCYRGIKWGSIFLFRIKKLNWDKVAKKINTKRTKGESRRQYIKLINILDKD